jgi:hypothetical protein
MLQTITKHLKRFKHAKRGLSNVIVVMLSLVILVVISANVILWSYQMNQLDWEKMKEDISITNVERINHSSWFVTQSEYTVNDGSYISGSYTDTQAADSQYERFTEALATPTYYPNGYNVLSGTYLSGTVPASVQNVDSDYLITRSAVSGTTASPYYPSGYTLGGSTTWVSGSASNLTLNDGVYMTFRSYASQSSSGTFGYTTAGSSYTTVSANYMYGSVFTSPAYSGMTVQNITFRGRRGSGTANVKGVLVRHSDLTIVAVGNPVSISNTVNWYTSTFSSPPSLSADTEYVIMLIPSASTRFYYGSGAINQGYYDSTNSYTTPTNPTDAAHNNNQYSIYCTFTYPSQYTCEVEFTGTSNIESWTQLVWTIDSSFTTDSVIATFQLYNNQTGSYPISGDGYLSDTIGTTDVTKTQTITTNPTYFRDASGNWKIKVKGVKDTNSQFDFKADLIEFKTTYYNQYTASTEYTFSNMNTHTPTQLNFTVISEYNTANVSVTIQVWNYSSSAYVNTGEGHLAYLSSGSNETKLLSINTNPQFYTSNGNAKIKITGVKSTTSQYLQKINQIKLYYKIENRLDINGVYVIDLATCPLAHIQSVEIQLRYRASDSGEKWYLKAYNWTEATYGDNGFNSTTGHTPTTGWDYYAVNFTTSWDSYVWNNGTIYIQFIDQGQDINNTTIDIDFLGVRVVIDGTGFILQNGGALTSHLISLWVNTATNHQRYDINLLVNSGENATYIRVDISLPTENFVVKVVTERGNIAVFAKH